MRKGENIILPFLEGLLGLGTEVYAAQARIVGNQKSELSGRFWCSIPRPGLFDEPIHQPGPLMQHPRIEVCAVWPNQCTRLLVKSHLIEQRQFPERAIQLTEQDWLKIDCLLCLVIEPHP
jgi:hypothetical protein